MKVLQLFRLRPDEHIPHEEGMVRSGTDDSNIDSVALVPASKAINDIYAISGIQVVDCPFAIDTPRLRDRC